LPANLALEGRRKKIDKKGSNPFDSKADTKNPSIHSSTGRSGTYSEMRPVPDILARNQLGSGLSVQIQEIEDIKNNVPCVR
jgi:hypothetical protein